MSIPLCYYGSPEPLPLRRVLRAGPLTAVYEAGDLRYVKVGGVEVCRRWYAAVRDHNWGTVPGVISDEVIEQTGDGFRVTYTSTHKQGDIHFVWRAEIATTTTRAWSSFGSIPSAKVVFRFDGEARSTFRRNRIGFCVLHPQAHAGLPVAIHHPDGTINTGKRFPDLIAQDNPFRDVSTIQPESSHQAWWTFEGDVFETEDQRNWIDASFKTFCTPLNRPFPVEVKTGERVTQTVSMSTIGGGVDPDTHLTMTLGDQVATLPDIGLSLAEHPTDHTLLRLLQPAHLRCELDLTRPGFADRLRHATAEATTAGAKLELAVTVSDNTWEETKALIDALHDTNPPLARVLAFHAAEWATPARIVTPIVEAVARFDPGVPVFVGTTANFTELNRGRPDLTHADGVCYSVQPQEHAFDNASLVECCAAIADTVRTARSFCGDKPIAVGPITLRKRVNPYATGPWEPPPPDPRQPTLFGAAWTLGALKYLAESGAASATFYETTGHRGVMDGTRVFPLFHVLADANELAGSDVLTCESSDPLRFDALMLRTGSRTRVLLANMTAEPQAVTLTGLPAEVQVRTLDETTFEFATADPVAFRRLIGDTLPPPAGGSPSPCGPTRMSASTADMLLSLRGVHKRFPGVHALKGVDFDVRRGEVHALVGENGAGKSTLMQILAGVHRPDSGELTFDGRTRTFASEREAQAAGVAIVFQERSLFGPLSVAENVFAGRQPGAFGVVDFGRMHAATADLLRRVGLSVDPAAAVETLSPGEQQLVEIAKALSLDAKLLILDEPTAALTPAETAALFGVVRGLKSQGVAVVYISHRLEEVFELADRVTVLKDGEGQGTFAVAEVTPQALVRKMVGRDVEFERPADRTPGESAVFEVVGLTDRGGAGRVRLADVSFTVRAGEIVGLGGLVGAGRTETAMGIFGARPGCAGEVRVRGQSVHLRSPHDAIAAGIGYVPEDRKEAGLFLDMGVADNVAVATLRGFVLNDVAQEQTARRYRDSLRIASRGGDEPVRALSGGNQQKVLLARWLEVNPAVLIVDEPTRGVDVGAKREVHAVLFELARTGTAVVVISSDLPELLALADRVVVLRAGRVAGELRRDELTEEAVIALSSGVAR